MAKKFKENEYPVYIFKEIDVGDLHIAHAEASLLSFQTIAGCDSFQVIIFYPNTSKIKADNRLCLCDSCKIQPMAPLHLPSSATTNPTSVHCLITVRQLHAYPLRRTTQLGEDTNSFHFASAFHSIIHPQRQNGSTLTSHPSVTETCT